MQSDHNVLTVTHGYEFKHASIQRVIMSSDIEDSKVKARNEVKSAAKAKHPKDIRDVRRSKYKNGYRWCARCETWALTNKYIHECGTRLRQKSKHYNVTLYKRY